jgi:hypothetical protein
MPKYLLLMYNKEMRMPRNVTRAQREEGMKPWRNYLNPLMKKGKIESSGPVARNGKVLAANKSKDYKARSVDLGGYMVIKAKNMAEAIEIAKRSPHAKTRMGPTTIRELMEM